MILQFGLSSLIMLSLLSNLYSQTVKDIDGNIYETIVLGDQIWMKQNLKVTHYLNGDKIGTIEGTVGICQEKSPKYQWPFGGNDSLTNSCGRLYTWYTIIDERKLCPAGWRIPSTNDVVLLRKYLGVDLIFKNNPDSSLFYHTVLEAGKQFGVNFKIKGGKRGCGGTFMVTAHSWWSEGNEDTYSKVWDLGPYYGRIKTMNEENNGYSVRCIKNK